jgi:hypothetical protein
VGAGGKGDTFGQANAGECHVTYPKISKCKGSIPSVSCISLVTMTILSASDGNRVNSQNAMHTKYTSRNVQHVVTVE